MRKFIIFILVIITGFFVANITFLKRKDNFLNMCIIFCVNVYFQGIRAIKYI